MALAQVACVPRHMAVSPRVYSQQVKLLSATISSLGWLSLRCN
jgi:hypothetical protein